jgi:hypothetical protein
MSRPDRDTVRKIDIGPKMARVPSTTYMRRKYLEGLAPIEL